MEVRLVRFFIDTDCEVGGIIELLGDELNHLRVLRLRPGNEVILCKDGVDFKCSILTIDKGFARLEALSAKINPAEPSVKCSVYIAHSKSDKIEHVIMKSVELGASEIIVFPCARCVSRPDAGQLGGKLSRWQRIARSAAEQSGRGFIPAVRAADSYESAIDMAVAADMALFLYENERNLSIKTALETAAYETVSIVSGPEGGFEMSETHYAQTKGMQIISIGPRILRCETAPIAALSAIMFHSGNL